MDTVTINEKATRNFTLYESLESLETVLIDQEMAVVVKEDTITYTGLLNSGLKTYLTPLRWKPDLKNFPT